jgi:hypothetical protein
MGLSSLKTCYSAKMLILPSVFSQKDGVHKVTGKKKAETAEG